MNLCLLTTEEKARAASAALAATSFVADVAPTSAAAWAEFLQVPLNPPEPSLFANHLVFDPQGVRYIDAQKRVLRIDFDEKHSDYQRKHQGKTNELIAKALGVSKGVKKILDLSVGMAVDSVFLAQLGFQVIGVERSPLLYVLLCEAFQRTRQEALKNYQLHFADSLDFLKQTESLQVDAIYFDPMYPHKKKSALPKQEMVVFRELVGHDEDAAKVLQAALEWNCQRVVVKRPLQAEPLLPGVRHTYEGKLVRYDVYMRSI